LYADDIIILSPSVHGLQLMLDAHSTGCDMPSLKLNYDKYKCIVFGKCCVKTAHPMMVQSNCIPWVDPIKYLGVSINGGHKLTFDIKSMKVLCSF
jgi:hypothetical protein